MFLLILNDSLFVAVLLILIPVGVLTTEVAAAVFARKIPVNSPSGRPPIGVVIPAHNEEHGIADTLRSIIQQLTQHDRLLVVADNCSDQTANVAKAEGAEVVSRTSKEKRGKGFALDFGIKALSANPPSIVIIVDADCSVTPGAIDNLARACGYYGRPVQAQYLMRNLRKPGLKMQIAEFAWLVKNLVRPTGLRTLGLPCLLTGSGMAFPWANLEKINLANAHIVEDMQLGLDLAKLGTAPIFCPEALIISYFPSDESGIKSQRTRWEHGHLGTILSEAPTLILQGLTKGNLSLVALAFELCVPPLALLFIEILIIWIIALAFYLTTGYRAPLLLTSCAAAFFALAVLTAWISHGRQVISFSRLLSAPIYPFRKIPMYVKFLFFRQKEWIRSKRDKD